MIFPYERIDYNVNASLKIMIEVETLAGPEKYEWPYARC
jgi:hypothetical protein